MQWWEIILYPPSGGWELAMVCDECYLHCRLWLRIASSTINLATSSSNACMDNLKKKDQKAPSSSPHFLKTAVLASSKASTLFKCSAVTRIVWVDISSNQQGCQPPPSAFEGSEKEEATFDLSRPTPTPPASAAVFFDPGWPAGGEGP